MKKQEKGYIYIFTNPSFPDYVKIGFAKDVEKRLNQLNKGQTTPFAFRCYATYEVVGNQTDKKIHKIIDTLDPSLRSVDYVYNKVRRKEFFTLTPEDALGFFKSIADINGLGDKVKLWKPTQEEKKAEEIAQNVSNQIGRRTPFKFSMLGIKPGEEINFVKDKKIKAIVIDDKHVEYKGENFSLSTLAKILLDYDRVPQGPLFFEYKGEKLSVLRERIEGGE